MNLKILWTSCVRARIKETTIFDERDENARAPTMHWAQFVKAKQARIEKQEIFIRSPTELEDEQVKLKKSEKQSLDKNRAN